MEANTTIKHHERNTHGTNHGIEIHGCSDAIKN